MGNAQNSQRFHQIDALRAVGLMLGIVAHGVWIFNADSSGRKFFFDVVEPIGAWGPFIWKVISSFRQELFFLIAGFFAHAVMLRYGRAGFARRRATHILLPLAIAAPTMIALDYLLQWYAIRMGASTTLQRPTLHPWAWHMWFLYYLLMIDVLMFVGTWAYGVFLPAGLRASLARVFDAALKRPWLVALPLIVGLFLIVRIEHPFATIIRGWVPIPVRVAYYGLCAATGWALFSSQERIADITRYRWPFLGVAIVAFSVNWAIMQGAGGLSASVSKNVQGVLMAVYAGSMTFGGIGWFTRLFPAQNERLRYLSDATYWMYLIHLPLMLFLQISLAHWLAAPLLKFFVVLGTVLAISLLSYAMFVRYTVIGAVLNRPRERPIKAAAPSLVT